MDYKKELRFFFLYAFKVVCVSFFFLKFAVMTSYKTAVLDNGLRIIALPTASPVVYCGYQLNVGTANELPGEEGIAHFCEHVTFKGTTRRTGNRCYSMSRRGRGRPQRLYDQDRYGLLFSYSEGTSSSCDRPSDRYCLP